MMSKTKPTPALRRDKAESMMSKTKPAPADIPDLRFFVEGRQATVDDVKEALITVAVDGLPDGGAIHVFNSNDTFWTWVADTPHKHSFATIQGTITMIQQMEKLDHTRAIKVQRSRAAWIEQELANLAEESGFEQNSIELLRRASIEAPLLEGPLLHTATCHEHWDGTGNAVFLLTAIPVPDFGWFGMDDKTTAIGFVGAGVLCEDTWYQGRSFWFGGIHLWWPPMQLSFAGWDDIASSGYCIGP